MSSGYANRLIGVVDTQGESAELHVVFAELSFTLEHLEAQQPSSLSDFLLLTLT